MVAVLIERYLQPCDPCHIFLSYPGSSDATHQVIVCRSIDWVGLASDKFKSATSAFVHRGRTDCQLDFSLCSGRSGHHLGGCGAAGSRRNERLGWRRRHGCQWKPARRLLSVNYGTSIMIYKAGYAVTVNIDGSFGPSQIWWSSGGGCSGTGYLNDGQGGAGGVQELNLWQSGGGPGTDGWAEDSGNSGAGTFEITSYDIPASETPEPGSAILLSTGVLALAGLILCRRQLNFGGANSNS